MTDRGEWVTEFDAVREAFQGDGGAVVYLEGELWVKNGQTAKVLKANLPAKRDAYFYMLGANSETEG